MKKNKIVRFISIVLALITMLSSSIFAVVPFSAYRSTAELKPLYYFNPDKYIYWNTGANWIQQSVYTDNVTQAVSGWGSSKISITKTTSYMSSNVDISVVYDTLANSGVYGYAGFYQPSKSKVVFHTGEVKEDWTFAEVYINHCYLKDQTSSILRSRVVSHEIGHTFGLDEELYDNKSVMSYSYTGSTAAAIDKTTVEYMYK